MNYDEAAKDINAAIAWIDNAAARLDGQFGDVYTMLMEAANKLAGAREVLRIQKHFKENQE